MKRKQRGYNMRLEAFKEKRGGRSTSAFTSFLLVEKRKVLDMGAEATQAILFVLQCHYDS